ncbi:putative bifunctional diguanylate cyclase/phosphodiesterase [Sphingomonas jatrophae]|uniref:EAL domain, c-di-GMP-specific phosphodiesterase class I (Or its enzymatically inactive variant) n=1 Tax=Sphingomonas jatrophae TaxID=1166337 RepID=A0A1I6L002_9SPHN|nr:bifunctional diguanylate cyclase/phosphodiesterase [Sphingomonas jatrophae]SFR96510.1 EAL domain, c-di-GMP-specific phosphodiesterase class I (or its enzymatically inactive variant) [Sphingomonas jatrophae]
MEGLLLAKGKAVLRDHKTALLAAVLGPVLAIGWCLWAGGSWALALGLAVLALVPLLALDEARRAMVRAQGLASPDRRPQTLTAAIDLMAARTGAQAHRSSSLHPVTRLPTREALVAAIEAHDAEADEARLLAVLRYADFDRIAAFDQGLAHHALGGLAKRIRDATGRNHLLAQVDRDCFAIWFAGQADLDAALGELRALAYLMMQELPSPSATLSPTIEVGLATYPTDGRAMAPLLTLAFTTRTRPQQAPDGSLLLAQPASLDLARETFVIEQDLAQAIHGEQLTMLFQPLVDLDKHCVVGAEALLRWQHPTMGDISPARFIPIVEAIGLSDQFGAWVLNAACREMRRWREAGLHGLRVAVNLSACQLADPKLQEKIERTLARHHLEPQVLELELTETAAMADAGRTLRLFREIHDLGVSLALDDFGSGHSSLIYLKNLPFDKLKIDREFVTAVHERSDSQAICKALIDLARGLGLRVLAEGVECRAEVDMLARLGCTLFQGYYFSRPLTGQAFVAFAGDPTRIPALGPPVLAQLDHLEGRLSA